MKAATKEETKIDPYKMKERWEKWKQNPIMKGVTPKNEAIIKEYLQDLELGFNTAINHVKGSRSPARLNALRYRIAYFAKKFKQLYNKECITDMDERTLLMFFKGVRDNVIQRDCGRDFTSSDTLAAGFTSFWHWYMRKSKKEGKNVEDITTSLNKHHDNKPRWVYINEEQFKMLYENAKYNYKVLMNFLWDSGIRAPTELVNIKVSDLEEANGIYLLNIRDEISKTFGRKIKLLLCSKMLKEYINTKGLKGDDRLFPICAPVVNRYLRRLGKRVLGGGVSKAGEEYGRLTMYDFRHNSCCYWLPRYKSESALMYRFGWKKSDKIHYYSELLGMKDTIKEEDLFVDVSVTEIERQLLKQQQENQILMERLDRIENISSEEMVTNLMNKPEVIMDEDFARSILNTVQELRQEVQELKDNKETERKLTEEEKIMAHFGIK